MFLYVYQRNTQLNYLSANVFVFLPRKFGWIYYFLPLKFCPFFAIYFLWKWAIMWKFSGPRGPWNCLLCVWEPCPWLGKIKVMRMIRICNTFRVLNTRDSSDQNVAKRIIFPKSMLRWSQYSDLTMWVIELCKLNLLSQPVNNVFLWGLSRCHQKSSEYFCCILKSKIFFEFIPVGSPSAEAK